MSELKSLGDYTVGDCVLILGSEGIVISIDEKDSMLVISSSRGISKVSPYVSSFTLKKLESIKNEPLKKIDLLDEETNEVKNSTTETSINENISLPYSSVMTQSNKSSSNISSENKPKIQSQVTNVQQVTNGIIEEDSYNFLSKWDFPVDFEYGDEVFSGIPSKETLIKIMDGFWHKKVKIKIEKPKDFRPRYKMKFGSQFLFDAKFNIYTHFGLVISVTARTPLETNAIEAESFSIYSDTLSWNDNINQFTETIEKKTYRSQDFFDVFQFSFCYEKTKTKTIRIRNLLSVLNTNNVRIRLGDINIPLEQDHLCYLKKNVLVYGAIEETLTEYYENQYEDQKNRWLEAKGFCSDANDRFLRSKELKEFKFRKGKQEATFVGHTGEQYLTTLTSCTCKDFSERDSEKREFIPCKHMFKLARKLGYFKGLSRLPIDREGFEFLESLDVCSSDDCSLGFSTGRCRPWRKPFIILDPAVKWRSLKTGVTGTIELYLGFQNIVFDPADGMDFEDSDYLKCRIEGDKEKPQDIYFDAQDTEHYRITQCPTNDIYAKLLSGETFNVEIFIYGEDEASYLFTFPETKGFGGYFLKIYHLLLKGY